MNDVILVVDDEPDTREAISDLLACEGYHVLPAAGGAEALDASTHGVPDLVISDLRMPGMDGIELLERFDFLYPQTPFLLLTAYGSCEAYRRAVGLGARDVLLKPFKNEELLRSVRHWLLESSLRA